MFSSAGTSMSFNSFWDATEHRRNRNRVRHCTYFQFLLGCYSRAFSNRGHIQRFQFLLGCYLQMRVGEAVAPVYLSIPFGMLQHRHGSQAKGADKAFQFLLGCYVLL